MSPLDGVLVIDKPPGITSHDVVDAVRKRLGTKRVGHGGTLDPDATGVLVVGVGRATRFLSYAQTAPKTYRAVARLGVTTSTQDASGEVLDTRPVAVDADDIAAAAKRFVGAIEQIAPMVSAVKVGGERLYRKARRGEEVERAPRAVTIYEFDLEDFSTESFEATFVVRCSGGTYVRTLVNDLGMDLGCGAHVKSLRRIEAAGFVATDAVALDDVSVERLRPLADVVAVLPRVDVTHQDAVHVAHGRALDAGVASLADGERVALVRDGSLLAVYRRSGERLVAERVVGA